MLRIARQGVWCAVLAFTGLSSLLLQAQQAKDMPAAPVPPQILTAKKVFISFAGQESNPNTSIFGEYSGGPNRTYNQFYLALKGWGRYELVAAPADCDLVFEIRFTDRMVEGAFSRASTGDSGNEPQFRLVIQDPKTHVVLWAFTEHVQSARLHGHRDKNFDQALAKIVDDVKNLATQSAAAVEARQ